MVSSMVAIEKGAFGSPLTKVTNYVICIYYFFGISIVLKTFLKLIIQSQN